MSTDLILQKLVEVLTPYQTPALALIALIVINVLTGVASALRSKSFDLQKLADFHRVSVLPQLVGWLSISALTSIATQAVLDPQLASAISGAQAWGMYGSSVASLIASIRQNVDEIMKPVVIDVEVKKITIEAKKLD